ncbi:Fc.00g001000.m01.CDS01 [Cosmosporella sp. VM-42]
MLDMVEPTEATVVAIKCGPVGLCAIISTLEYEPKNIFAIDGVESRLEVAIFLRAEALNFLEGRENMIKRIMEVTGGRGAGAVIEVVGLSQALRMAYEIIRPLGVISSIGVHNADKEHEDTNGTQALRVLAKNQDKLGFMFDKIMSLTDAAEAYELFDKMKVQKVVFLLGQ